MAFARAEFVKRQEEPAENRRRWEPVSIGAVAQEADQGVACLEDPTAPSYQAGTIPRAAEP
jgi:hypothetical protein